MVKIKILKLASLTQSSLLHRVDLNYLVSFLYQYQIAFNGSTILSIISGLKYTITYITHDKLCATFHLSVLCCMTE